MKKNFNYVVFFLFLVSITIVNAQECLTDVIEETTTCPPGAKIPTKEGGKGPYTFPEGGEFTVGEEKFKAEKGAAVTTGPNGKVSWKGTVTDPTEKKSTDGTYNTETETVEEAARTEVPGTNPDEPPSILSGTTEVRSIPKGFTAATAEKAEVPTRGPDGTTKGTITTRKAKDIVLKNGHLSIGTADDISTMDQAEKFQLYIIFLMLLTYIAVLHINRPNPSRVPTGA